MEKKVYGTPDTYDIKNKGCDPEEVEVLCDIFERLMQQQANSTLSKGTYDLKNFESAEYLEINAFSLTMERYEHPDQDEWKGLFEAKGRSLEVWGTLEPAA